MASASYSRQEPYELNVHVRICAGGARRRASLPRYPIGEEGGAHLYGFVYNSPVDWRDSLGLEAKKQGPRIVLSEEILYDTLDPNYWQKGWERKMRLGADRKQVTPSLKTKMDQWCGKKYGELFLASKPVFYVTGASARLIRTMSGRIRVPFYYERTSVDVHGKEIPRKQHAGSLFIRRTSATAEFGHVAYEGRWTWFCRLCDDEGMPVTGESSETKGPFRARPKDRHSTSRTIGHVPLNLAALEAELQREVAQHKQKLTARPSSKGATVIQGIKGLWTHSRGGGGGSRGRLAKFVDARGGVGKTDLAAMEEVSLE